MLESLQKRREPQKFLTSKMAKIANKGVVRSKFVEKSWSKIFGVPWLQK